MKLNFYFFSWSQSSWLRNVSLLFALTVSAMLNSVVAQRIVTSGGTYTIDNTGTNTGTNFTSFTNAINDLNFGGTFSGNITINVAAGQTFTENAPVITATGNSGAHITFIKSGGGSNPKITASGTTTSNGDAAIVINGGDYFTFNGIDITASDSSLEFGYLIRKSSYNNAAQFNTITNSTILMSRLKTYSYAILQSSDSIINSSFTAFNTSTNALAQANNNNTYTNVTVGNAYNGIWLKGISTTYRDSNNVCDFNSIGRTGFSNDFGALTGFTNCYGIYASNQFTYRANNNTVKNTVSTGNTYSIYTDGSVNVKHNNNDFSAQNTITNNYYYIYDIYLSNTTTGEVLNNNIHDINADGMLYNYVYGIYASSINTIRVANNTINNVSAYYIYNYYLGTATNCRLTANSISNINITGGGATYLFYVSGGSADTLDNNTANNCLSSGSVYGVYTATAVSFRVYNNVVENVVAGTSGSGTIYGIYSATPNNTNIYNNTIRNVKSLAGGSTSYGMYLTTITGTCNFYNNKVSDFGNPSNAISGTGSIYGAYFSNATSGTVTCNFNNNVINGLTKTYTGAASATRYLHGLYFSTTSNATATYNIIHNTVSIDGTFSLNSSSQVVYTAPTAATSPIMTLRNNIFANNTGAQTGAAKHYLIWANGAGRLGSASSSSNFNTWFTANSTNGFFGYNTADKADLAAWVATTGFTAMEANSITGDPLFNTATNSRLLFGSTSANTGSFIATYTTDILGALRNTSTPSRGAYEIPMDETKPILSYTPALNVFSTTNYTLTNFATITDGANGFVANTAGVAPRLYYKKSTTANVFAGNTATDNGWKYVEASNTTSPFSFTIDHSILLGGSANTGDTIHYFVVASDTAAIANITANPSAGFVGTGVGAITTAPTNPNSYIIFGVPAVYNNATVTQTEIAKAGRGSADNQIIRVQVSTALTGSPAYISQLDFTTLGGGNDSANLASAKVYFTGSNPNFSVVTATAFGSTAFAPVVTGPIGTFSVTGNALCSNGNNYFWLVYTLRNAAVIGDSVDAELTSVTYNGTPQPYSGGATSGSRTIKEGYCATSILYTGYCTNRVQLNTLNVNSGATCLALPGYVNYLDTGVATTTVLKNNTYNLTWTPNGTYVAAGVWFDWNDDGIFATTEFSRIVLNTEGSTNPVVIPITVPCASITGKVRMRVRTNYYNSFINSTSSCGQVDYGETEDYTITVADNPIVFTAGNVSQDLGIVAPNSTNAQLLRIAIKTPGCGTGTITEMHFNTSGSTNATTDITAAKLYKTGNGKTFDNTAVQIGSTVASPVGAFSFLGLTDTLLSSQTDTNNYWLVYDIASGAGLGNQIDARVDSINILGAYIVPNNNNPAGTRLVVAPMTYVSSTTSHPLLTKVARGSNNNTILGLNIITSPTGSPITVSSLDISTNGTDSLPDITNLKIWYTGNSNTFAATTQFGTTVASPSTTQTVTGARELTTGNNYFWVTYDIAGGSALGHVVDAELTSVTIAGITQIPAVTAPTGNRQIKADYCAASYTSTGYCTQVVSFNTLNVNSGTTCLALPAYINYRDTGVATTTVSKNNTYNFTWTPNGTYIAAGVWFDWNDDGIFATTEFTQIAVNTANSTAPVVLPITIPCTAVNGKIRMRVRTNYYFNLLTNTNSCGSLSQGETEDYDITISDNPVAYMGSTVSQTSAIIAPAAINAQILRIPVKTGGCGVGLVTDMYFNTIGSTNASTDITSAKLYSTGTSRNFNTSKLLGTVSSPNGVFTFTGLMDTVLTGSNDTNNYWLAYDIAPSAVLANVVDARIDSITIIGGNIVPSNNNPSGSRLIVAPMTYTSSTVTQTNTSKVAQGELSKHIVGLQVVTSAVGSAIDLTSLDIATTGTDSLLDITNLKVWYTGTSNSFATTDQFGSTIAVPSATNTVIGLTSLTNGTNYFWVTYDINSAATIGHAVDAEITSITLANLPVAPSVTAPVGNRLIRAPYCSPTYTTGKTDGDLISNIVIAGTTFSNNTGTSPVNPYYTFFTGAPNLTATLVQGGTYNVTVSIGSFTNQGIAAWVDYNDDGVFAPSEKIGNTSVAINTAFGSATFPITLTCASVPGDRRMRVRGVYANAGPTIDPCANYGYGEVEDYIITIANNPVHYVSSSTIQTTGIVAPGTTNAKLLRVPLIAAGCGIQSTSEMRFNTTGTTSTSDITTAKLFATGNSAVFNTNKLLGSVSSPNGQFTFNSYFDTLLVTFNDTNNYWLVYDLSSSAPEHNFVDAQVDSIGMTGSYFIPSNNNPAGNREIITPMLFVSSTVTAPVLSKVGIGESNHTIVRYEVTTSATGAPIFVTSFDIGSLGTTSLSDITNLKVYYTGTNAAFNSTAQFGSTIASPALTQTLTGTQGLANGTNYFWVTYDIANGATIDNFVDAEITSVTIDGIPQTPTVTAPAGSRQIRNAYCTSNATTPATYEDIGNVTLVTAGATVLNNGNAIPSLNNPSAVNGYTNFTTNVAKAQLYQGQSVDLSIGIINIDAFSYNDMAAIYIDYNQDGDFADVNEMAWSATTFQNANTGPFIGSFRVPNGALLGETRMRVVLTYTTVALIQSNACGTYTYGETEDYMVNINQLPSPSVYTWNQTGSANFNTASNWTPTRTIAFANDILLVNGGGSVTMTAVPNHSVRSLNISNTTALTLVGTSEFITTDTLSIEAGSQLKTSAMTFVVGTDTSTIGNIAGTGKISGNVKRWVNTSTLSYNFPLAVNSNNRSMNITYTTPPTANGTITLNYAVGAPGAGGLPTSDVSLGLSLVNISTAGVWNVTNTDGLTGGTFSIVSNADGIADAPVVAQTSIVYRTDGFGSWAAVGTATSTLGTPSALELNRAGLTAYGQFGIAGTSSNPLPVNLTSFSALAKANDANLTWTTASEINNKGFEVERSVDGKSFVKVSFVKGAGNSNEKLTYALTDVNAFGITGSAILYYRLKQVDFNGKSNYSQTVKVSVNTENVNVISVYPNPFTTDYSVSFASAKNGEATIVMVDMQGRKVANITTTINNGMNIIPVTNMETIEAGVYFITVTVAGETQTIKLLKN